MCRPTPHVDLGAAPGSLRPAWPPSEIPTGDQHGAEAAFPIPDARNAIRKSDMTSPVPHKGASLCCFLCDHDLLEAAPDSFHASWNSPQLFRESFTASWDSAQVRNLIHHARASYEVQDGCKQFTPSCKKFTRYHTNTGVLFTHPSASAGQPEDAVFVAHSACWKVAQRSGVSSARLYDFAASTTPLSPWARNAHAPIFVSELVGALNHGTPLGGLLVEMAGRLPEELHREIMGEVEDHVVSLLRHGKTSGEEYNVLQNEPGVLFTRLATVQGSALPLIHRGLQDAHSHVPGKDSDELQTIYIRTVELFGQSYLSEVGFNGTVGNAMSVPVRSEDIRAVRFALGRFGLRGLRVLYADGSSSSWLGSTSGCWIGNVEGYSLRDLEVLAEVLVLHARSYDHKLTPV